jgi:hypothetical protein
MATAGLLSSSERSEYSRCRAQLDAGDVAQAHDLAVRPGLDDDVAELLLALQAALGVDRQLQLGHAGAGRRRRRRRRRPARSARGSRAPRRSAVRPRAATFCGSSQTRIA